MIRRFRIQSLALFLTLSGAAAIAHLIGVDESRETQFRLAVIRSWEALPIIFELAAIAVIGLLCILLYLVLTSWRREARRSDAEKSAQQQRARLQDFIEVGSEWLWETDAAGRITYLSPRFSEITGIPKELILGCTRTDLLSAADGRAWQVKHIEAAVKDRLPFHDITYKVKVPGSRTFWIRTNGKPTFDAYGEYVGFRGTASDVTVEQELRAASEKSHAHFLAALDALPAPVLVYDSDGRLRSWNAAVGGYFISVADQLVAGSTFSALMAKASARGTFVTAGVGDWVNRRVQAHIEGRQDDSLQLTDGRWLQASHSHTAYGGTVTIWVDVTAVIEREQALAGKTVVLDAILENMDQAVCVYDESQCLVLWNNRLIDLLQLPADLAVVGQPMSNIVAHVLSSLTADRESIDQLVDGIVRRAVDDVPEVIERMMPNGSTVEIRTGIMPHGGQIKTFTDVTRRIQVEHQLRQSQKMEAIGQLAGGMAHEFNNLLTAIGGFSRMAQRKVGQPDFVADCLNEVILASDQAAGLTSQMLAYSRKQVSVVRVVEVDQVIGGLEKLLRPLLGEAVDVSFDLAGDGAHARVDPGQISQSIINLAINARDAMPAGGRLTIGSGLVTLPDGFVATHLGQGGGTYCSMFVRDAGTGIDPENLARIFEPFFTTKEQGQGTGLGLAVVYGLIEQAGGMIDVHSTIGDGTIFTLYLPAVSDDVTATTRDGNEDADTASRPATVLLVEDDSAVRRYVRMELESLGYDVLTAVNGRDAIDLEKDRADQPIDVLLTDVVMPVMGGIAAASVLVRRRPDMKVIYMSGYPKRGAGATEDLGPDATLLYKPVTRSDVGRALTAALSARAVPQSNYGEGVAVDG